MRHLDGKNEKKKQQQRKKTILLWNEIPCGVEMMGKNQNEKLQNREQMKQSLGWR